MNSSKFSVLGSRLWEIIVLCITIISCGPKTDNEQFYMTPVPRLMKYYDAIENGDTLFKIVPVDTFINQNGNVFSTAELKGNISVVQLFFTSCEGICPVISNHMAMVQKEFAGNSNVNLVSYSVDPARDSAAALQKYCTRFSCDSTQWTLVTGDKKKLYDLIRYGYQLPDIEPGKGDEDDFIHSDQIVLVDRNSIIRGYYGGTDTAQVRMLIEDIHILINEK
jgi:protein SCO1/2